MKNFNFYMSLCSYYTNYSPNNGVKYLKSLKKHLFEPACQGHQQFGDTLS